MTEKLTERLKKSNLPERNQLILALAPGCMFGCPPSNLNKLIERVDCPTCRTVMEKVKEAAEILSETREMVDDYCQTIRTRNTLRQEYYNRCRRIFILGHFFKPPQLVSELEYLRLSWYVNSMKRVKRIEEELELLTRQDVPHWGDEENREISREVVGIFRNIDSLFTPRL